MRFDLNILNTQASRILAVVLVLGTFLLAQPPKLPAKTRANLAQNFAFTKISMPEPSEYLSGHSQKTVRDVHPSLKRISAWISATGAAVALADLDCDGIANDYCFIDPRADVVLVGGVPGTAERYGKFVLDPNKLAAKPLVDKTMAPVGSLIGDFNEDGRADILVYYFGRTPLLFLRNDKQLSASAFSMKECAKSQRWFTGAATQTDLDGDGHVDLLIANYFQDGAKILDGKATGQQELHDAKSKSFNGGYKHFLLADGKGNFKEAKTNLSEQVLRGWTIACGAADLNADHLPELYLANDLGPDRLLLNKSTPGKLQFDVVQGQRDMFTPASSVLGNDSYKGMGLDFADVNADGFLDIYVSNIAAEYGFMESHYLWQSTGDLDKFKKGLAPYKQASEDLNLSRSGWGWDCRLADFNNDGSLEAIQATGFIKGKINRWPELQALGTGNDQMMHDARNWPSFKPGDDVSGHELTAFFVRAEDGRYYNLAKEIGLKEPMVSRGIAVADVDADGDLDFIIANQWESSILYRNDSKNHNKFIQIVPRLAIRAGTTAAIGVQAKAYLPDGRVIAVHSDGGSGHSGKRSPEIQIGLGNCPADLPIKVELTYRNLNGTVEQANVSLKPGRHVLVMKQGGVS